MLTGHAGNKKFSFISFFGGLSKPADVNTQLVSTEEN